MREAFFGIVISLVVLVNCRGKWQKKGLVVEVQSHNQAMKSANPISDLEQTISEGMNDPFTDPRFVMNRINDEFFGDRLKNNINAGTPMVESSLHNKELLAFRNMGLNAQSLSDFQSKMMPSDPITQHAIKDDYVPVRKQATARNRGILFPNTNKMWKFLEMSKHFAAAPKASAEPEPPVANMQKMAMEPKEPTNYNVASLSAESIPSTAGSSQNGESGVEAAAVPDANDQVLQTPQNNAGAAPQSIGDTLSSMLSQTGSKAADVLANNPGAISGRELEDNYSSIKAFLEADTSLRQKKVLDPVTNPLEDLMHKKQHVPKAKSTRKVVRSK